MNFARRLLENETLRAEIEDINRLSGEQRWDEVIPIVERALTRAPEPPVRHFLELAHRRTTGFQKIHRAVDRANQGDAPAARTMLLEVLAAEPEPTVELEAKRVLREIARRADRDTQC